MMSPTEKLPVVIGAGLAGLLISRRLSEEGVQHILLGGRPDFAGPVLGESMNFVSSIEFDRYFKDFNDSAYPKDWILLMGGVDFVIGFDFVRFLGTWPAVPALQWAIGVGLPKLRLIHLDRLRFDPELYARVTAMPGVRRVEAEISSIDYDAASDRITGLHLNDGSLLEPSCVFDATNGRRLLAKALNIPMKPIGGMRQVYYAHFHGHCGEEELWQNATNILGIKDEGITGLAWAIPLGSYVSVGVSLLEAPTHMDAEEVIAATIRAYARRGVDVLARFPTRGRVRAHPHQYYTHERAYGANYLLASGSMAQINFASSTGVTTAMAAAEVAGRFARGDAQAGANYQRFIERVVSSAPVFDGLEQNSREMVVNRELPIQWYLFGMRRVSSFYTLKAAIRPRWAANFLLHGMIRLLPTAIWGIGRFLKINAPDQVKLFEPRALTADPSNTDPRPADPRPADPSELASKDLATGDSAPSERAPSEGAPSGVAREAAAAPNQAPNSAP